MTVRKKRVTARKKRKPKKPAAGRGKKALRWLAILASACVAVSVTLVLPLRWMDPVTTAFILRDNSGRVPPLHEWIDWQQLGSALPLAVVAAEDQRFADHHGLDIREIRKSLVAAEQGAPLRGASTITQQLSKNLFLTPTRSLWRKGVEAYLSVIAEICLPKRRILEIYLNVVELGPGIYGAGAASKHYFGKSAAELNDTEAALLAAVLPNPMRRNVSDPSPAVRERQYWIISQMQRLRREDWLSRL